MIEALAGPSALVAAAATVVGAAFLLLFFSRGQPWGTLNDLASIVLMLATIPVAIRLVRLLSEAVPGLAEAVAAVGIVGMLTAGGAQVALVLKLGTYRGLLPYTLGGGAIVGIWYLLVGVTALTTRMPTPLALLALAAGVGYLAIGFGFWRWGEERRPLTVVGGTVLLLASTAFLGWLGIALVAGQALTTA